MYLLIRKFLFYFDAEKVHHWVMNRLKYAYSISFIRKWMKSKYTIQNPLLERSLWGIHFPNPVGLAGGFDKNGEFTDPLACLGFGFIEVGTVTPLPQDGNDKPRLFRLPADKALLNRMGFNNKGAAYTATQLQNRQEKIIIGGNIGKNKDTPNENATDDYEKCFKELYNYVDFFILNVSSPNTPGLRELQNKEPLTLLINRLMALNTEMGNAKPILLKISPDNTNEQLNDIIEIVLSTGLHGIVATNTTTSRYGLSSPGDKVTKFGAGGISGQPVKNRATEIVSYIHNHSYGKIPIIACGGIFTAKDALDKLNAGASLVQLYTGFIYEGPEVAKKICEGLLAR